MGCVCAPNPILHDSTATTSRALTLLQHGVVEGRQGQLLCPAGLTEVGVQPGCTLLQWLRHEVTLPLSSQRIAASVLRAQRCQAVNDESKHSYSL